MMFGRVEAVAIPIGDVQPANLIRIIVYLESGRSIKTVRDFETAPLRPILGVEDLAWHADQFAQETIGTDLALEGWEVIGGGDIPEPDSDALVRSAAYAVRKL